MQLAEVRVVRRVSWEWGLCQSPKRNAGGRDLRDEPDV